jgi:hypothetical protein
MRNEMIGAVVRRAIEQPAFRKELLENPQEALSSHGFVLEGDDLAELLSVRESLQSGEGADVEQRLLTIAEDYGIRPSQD